MDVLFLKKILIYYIIYTRCQRDKKQQEILKIMILVQISFNAKAIRTIFIK